MGLYNFQPQFAPHILSGRKTHTIRAPRANPDKPGNTMHLYIGLRTRSVDRIGLATCSKIEEIRILRSLEVCIADNWLSADERESLAFHDGFENFPHMIQFWDGRLPFYGSIIYWKDFRRG